MDRRSWSLCSKQIILHKAHPVEEERRRPERGRRGQTDCSRGDVPTPAPRKRNSRFSRQAPPPPKSPQSKSEKAPHIREACMSGHSSGRGGS